jgi:hypothetical protein
MDTLTKQVRSLRIYVAVLTVIVIACLISLILLLRGPRQTEAIAASHLNVDELTARRINIVEPDGRLALVISDHARQHPGAMNGKDLPARDRPAGLIYFNEEGDECGGFTWDGTKKENGMTLTADQYKNDQIMALYYQQDSGLVPSRSYGFRLWDRSDSFTLARELDYVDSLQKLHDPAAYDKGIDALKKQGLMGVDRLFLGRTKDGLTGLFLRDNKGIPRLRICIGKENEPLIQTLDDQGRVVGSLLAKSSSKAKGSSN